VVVVVVAVNQVSAPRARVLGETIRRCTADGAPISTGAREVRAEALTVSMMNGKPGAVLLPPLRLHPGGAPEAAAARLALGARGGRKGTLTVAVNVSNPTSCPVAISSVRVSARRDASSVEEVGVTF